MRYFAIALALAAGSVPVFAQSPYPHLIGKDPRLIAGLAALPESRRKALAVHTLCSYIGNGMEEDRADFPLQLRLSEQDIEARA